jgi:hypothetical protein
VVSAVTAFRSRFCALSAPDMQTTPSRHGYPVGTMSMLRVAGIGLVTIAIGSRQ